MNDETASLSFVKLHCLDVNSEALIDTGARVGTILMHKIPSKYRNIRPANGSLIAANNQRLHCSGYVFFLPVQINGYLYVQKFYVVRDLRFDCIVSQDFVFEHQCRLDYKDLMLH